MADEEPGTAVEVHAGRPRIELTDEQRASVAKLAPVLTTEQLCDYLGISETTLRRRMQEDPEILADYRKGKAAAIASVATSLLRQANAGNVRAISLYLRSQAGWGGKKADEDTDGKYSASDMDKWIHALGRAVEDAIDAEARIPDEVKDDLLEAIAESWMAEHARLHARL